MENVCRKRPALWGNNSLLIRFRKIPGTGLIIDCRNVYIILFRVVTISGDDGFYLALQVPSANQ